jgi:hypothetical protein
LGEHDRARQLFAETAPDVDEQLRSQHPSWNRRATLELLRAEAEALIGPGEADEAPVNGERSGGSSAEPTSNRR